MTAPHLPPHPPQPDATALIAALESALSGVSQALAERNGEALEQHSRSVQQLLSAALEQGRRGELSPQARQKLAQAGARLAAERASLSRASAAFDRALDALMPSEPLGLYGAGGRSLKRRSSGDSVSA